MSLRFRLNLMIALAMLVIIGTGTAFVIHNARRSVLAEVHSSVDMALRVIDKGLSQSRDSEGELMNWMQNFAVLQKIRNLRIQVPDKIIKLSAPPENELDDSVPSWFAWAVSPDSMIGEKQVTLEDGSIARMAVEANPRDEIAEAWSEARSFLFLMGLLAMAVSALVHFTLGRAFKSVGVILQGLENIERGQFSQPLPPFSLPEFDRISNAFNQTAQSLAKAREENRKLTQQSLSIQEEERRFLAMELHDELGQSLSAIKSMAASLSKTADPQQHDAIVEGIMSICNHLFGVVRAMMRRLRPLMLDDLGLSASLEDLIHAWAGNHPDTRIDFSCAPGVDEHAGDAKIHLYRMAQESLTNVAKHANAKSIQIILALTDSQDSRAGIKLRVSDDGMGFDPLQRQNGFGLQGMRERVESLGGTFTVNTSPGAGVTLEALIPCGATNP